VLVRGGELAPDILSADAVRYCSVYGTYGISVFAVRDATAGELAQQVPLVRVRQPGSLEGRGRPGCGDEGWSRRAVTRGITPWASMTWRTAYGGWPVARTRSCRTRTTTRNLDGGGI
jgi:hypothetical protein